jgi:aminomuconate-semialdehyde/2-hydroxymuconate-6-semialdehyde dehydrogenase
MQAAAQGVKPVSFELGGKNAAVVFADADFDKAVAGVARSTFTNCGQVCLCTERVYVERPIFDKFVAELKKQAESIVVGDPYDESVTMGPLVSHKHREKVLSYFELAKEEGATLVTGGGVPTFDNHCSQGSFVEPTVFTGLSDDARINREEIFGPVCHVSPFDSEEEVLQRVNQSDYGLACAIWTESLARAHRLAPKVDTGITWVNTWFLRDLRTPFGGVKLSGIGREGGQHSLAFYSEPQNICIKLDD